MDGNVHLFLGVSVQSRWRGSGLKGSDVLRQAHLSTVQNMTGSERRPPQFFFPSFSSPCFPPLPLTWNGDCLKRHGGVDS